MRTSAYEETPKVSLKWTKGLFIAVERQRLGNYRKMACKVRANRLLVGAGKLKPKQGERVMKNTVKDSKGETTKRKIMKIQETLARGANVPVTVFYSSSITPMGPR